MYWHIPGTIGARGLRADVYGDKLWSDRTPLGDRPCPIVDLDVEGESLSCAD